MKKTKKIIGLRTKILFPVLAINIIICIIMGVVMS